MAKNCSNDSDKIYINKYSIIYDLTQNENRKMANQIPKY